jgi:hypothetical protein
MDKQQTVDIQQVVKWDQDATADLTAARNTLRQMNDVIMSRELSLAITNVEQAMLWQAAGRSGVDSLIALSSSHIPGNSDEGE